MIMGYGNRPLLREDWNAVSRAFDLVECLSGIAIADPG